MDLSVIPETHRDRARAALDPRATSIKPVIGGASGALTYKVATPTGNQLLRMEANISVLRNARQYECMGIAADAGIAPPIHFLDAERGVVVLPFIDHRPIEEFGTPS
jgi:hypothetical protein